LLLKQNMMQNIIDLDDIARLVYEQTLPDLPEPVTFTDRLMLAMYAVHISDYERLRQQIADEGDTMADQNGVEHKHPLGIPMAKADAMANAKAVLLKIDRKQRVKSQLAGAGKAKPTSLRKLPRQTGT
jgi:phage terminase small subunit